MKLTEISGVGTLGRAPEAPELTFTCSLPPISDWVEQGVPDRVTILDGDAVVFESDVNDLHPDLQAIIRQQCDQAIAAWRSR